MQGALDRKRAKIALTREANERDHAQNVVREVNLNNLGLSLPPPQPAQPHPSAVLFFYYPLCVHHPHCNIAITPFLCFCVMAAPCASVTPVTPPQIAKAMEASEVQRTLEGVAECVSNMA